MDNFTTLIDGNSKQSTFLPPIPVTGRRLQEITRDAIFALDNANSPPEYFAQGGAVVRFRTDEQDRPLLEAVNVDMLIGRLARVANFYKVNAHGQIANCDPSPKVAKDILAKGSWPFLPIDGIVEAPVLRSDGSIMMEQGYDPQTHLYYYPAPGATSSRIIIITTSPKIHRRAHI